MSRSYRLRRRRKPAWWRGSVRLYRALLWLYPPSLRRTHGDEMAQVFRDMLRDEVQRAGPPGALRAWGGVVSDLAASLPREWPRELMRRRIRVRRSVVSHRASGVITGYTITGRIGSNRGQAMNDNFEKFTERARKVLSLAQEEAQRFNHNYIGTEHILLGLVREGDGVAAKVLANLGVELNKARSSVEFIIGRGDRIVMGEVGLTPRAKKVIELAVDEARRLNHHYVGTEHLLLGLIREGEGIAAGVLESLGVRLENARRATLEVLNQGGGFDVAQRARGGQRSAAAEDLGKFTERARRVIAAAITDARERNQREVGTGHVLLALIHEREGIAAQALRKSGLDLVAAQHEVEQVLPPREPDGERPTQGPIDLDTHTLRMIALAADEAAQMGHPYVGTEHLLLGLIREGDGLGAQVLHHLAANLNQLRVISMQASARAENLSARRPAIGRITLICRDVAVTGQFYIDNFGATPVTTDVGPSEPPALRLPGGGALLALRAAAPDATPAGAATTELDIVVGDVDLVWRTLKDSNVADLAAVSDSPRGGAFSVRDPDGRLLHVYAHGD